MERVQPENAVVVGALVGVVAAVAGVIGGIALAAHGTPDASGQCMGDCKHPNFGIGLCMAALSIALGALIVIGFAVASSIATLRSERIVADRR